MESKKSDTIAQNKAFVWVALITGLILLIPLVAMLFSDQVDWKLNDFVIMGTLLFGTGSLFVLAARKVTRTSRRIVLAAVFAVILLYLWAELAVGVFTNWGS